MITERQDLCLNMTTMSDDEVKTLIAEGAENLNAELKIGLSSCKLLKTEVTMSIRVTKNLKLTREKTA